MLSFFLYHLCELLFDPSAYSIAQDEMKNTSPKGGSSIEEGIFKNTSKESPIPLHNHPHGSSADILPGYRQLG